MSPVIAPARPGRRTRYVQRTRWDICERADAPGHFRPQRCPHDPRCTTGPAGFGRERSGWTRVRGSRARAEREALAWREQGWATAIVDTSPAVRAQVRAWEAAAKGHPGETGGAR